MFDSTPPTSNLIARQPIKPKPISQLFKLLEIPMVTQCINPHLHLHFSTPHRHRHLFPTLSLKYHHLKFPPSTLSPPFSLSSISPISKPCSNSNSKSIFIPMSSSSSSITSNQSSPDNDDLRPTTPDQRTFSWLDISTLWIGLVVGVPSYYLAGSLVDLGMLWWQGIATVVAANAVTLTALVLTAHPGTKYGIPFPILTRSSFGIHGSHIPTLLRSLIGCGWYGIETWIGGQAIFLLLPQSFKKDSFFTHFLPWLGTSPLEFACFLVFWIAQLSFVLKGMDGIRKLEKYSAPVLILLTLCLLFWAYVKAGGFGHMLISSSSLSLREFWSLFFPSLTANISFWAPLALNIPDFSRYAKSQKDQIIGQLGLPVYMGAFTFVGLAVTSATEVIFGHVISSPIQLLGEIGGLTTTVLAIFGISLAIITTNIAANVVAPANALVNFRPDVFTFRTGALLTAVLGIAFQPWRLLRSSESFIYTWLVGYSALLGPIGGVILMDYYVIRRRELSVKDLYSSSPYGAYYYHGGFNLAAIIVLVVGVLPVIPGFLQKVGIVSRIPEIFGTIYNNAWFFSSFLAGFCYWGLSVLFVKQEDSSQQPLLPTPEN